MKKIFLILPVSLYFPCNKLEELNLNKKDFATVSGESLYNGGHFNSLTSCRKCKLKCNPDVDAAFCQYNIF